jgi:hypothetical protein
MGLKKKYKEIPKHFVVADEPEWELKEWLKFITKLAEKYGNRAILEVRGHYSGASLLLKDKKEK